MFLISFRAIQMEDAIMWEVYILAVATLAALLFVGRAWYRKITGGRDEHCQCGGTSSTEGGTCWESNRWRGPGATRGAPPGPGERVAGGRLAGHPGEPVCATTPSACCLIALEPGKRGTVLALTGGREFQAKLISMGFNVGSEVTVLESGVGGGGLLVATGDTRLAIGNDIAERIVVAVDPTDGLVC